MNVKTVYFFVAVVSSLSGTSFVNDCKLFSKSSSLILTLAFFNSLLIVALINSGSANLAFVPISFNSSN